MNILIAYGDVILIAVLIKKKRVNVLNKILYFGGIADKAMVYDVGIPWVLVCLQTAPLSI